LRKKGSNRTAIAMHSHLAAGLRRYCNLYSTAPCRHQRDTRAIGSGHKNKDRKMGKSLVRRIESGTDCGRRAIFTMIELREVHQWQLNNRKAKRKRSIGSCMSSSTGSSKAVADKR